MMTIDTTNMCSRRQRKLFEKDGMYHSLWIAMQDDPELTAVVRSRQLHIYRDGKKVLILTGKSSPLSFCANAGVTVIIKMAANAVIIVLFFINFPNSRYKISDNSAIITIFVLSFKCY